jgi:FdrA protein|tara:strand:+ start:10452 stop:10628 length:177 start_codon:yes stop_codon:yes gene_type:complete
LTDTTDIQGKKIVVINIGLELFADTLKDQDVDVINVDWRPPAGGDKKMAELLNKLGDL